MGDALQLLGGDVLELEVIVQRADLVPQLSGIPRRDAAPVGLCSSVLISSSERSSPFISSRVALSVVVVTSVSLSLVSRIRSTACASMASRVSRMPPRISADFGMGAEQHRRQLRQIGPTGQLGDQLGGRGSSVGHVPAWCLQLSQELPQERRAWSRARSRAP